MLIILLCLLLFISIACLFPSESERKGLKFLLSVALAFFLALVMEGTIHSLLAAQIMEGMILGVAYFGLPIIIFSTFQLLIYDIKFFHD